MNASVIICPSCWKQVSYTPQQRGQMVVCPHCSHQFRITSPSQTGSSIQINTREAPVSRGPSRSGYRRRPARKNNSALLIVGGLAVAALVVGGIVALVMLNPSLGGMGGSKKNRARQLCQEALDAWADQDTAQAVCCRTRRCT